MNILIRMTALILLVATTNTALHAQVKNDSTLKELSTGRVDSLKAVTVTAAKPVLVQKAGKIIMNVAESPVAAGGNAWEVVKRAPGVTDQRGALQLRGKKVTVLVDGRTTNLDAVALKNLLNAMPANGIATVELVPNPSARYDAEGGAVINIITKQSKKLGTSGTLTAGVGAGFYARYNGGFSLNHRSTKLNLYGSYDHQRLQTYSDEYAKRETGNLSVVDEHTHYITTAANHFMKAGIDYTISPRQSIGLLVKGTMGIVRSNSRNLSSAQSIGKMIDSFSTATTIRSSRISTPMINLYYKAKLDSTGRELQVNADYFTYNKKWNDMIDTRYFAPNGEETGIPLMLRDQSPATNTVRSVSIDYTQPFKGGKLETGIKGTFTTTDNDVLWEQQLQGGWKTDSGKTNHFIYKENVTAAYLNFSKSHKKFGIQAGLRVEQTTTTGNLVTSNTVNKNRFLNWFPSIAVSYDQSDAHQFNFSYRKSISRFKFDVVNPFIVYKSQYAYYQGNPAIRPGIAHNFELSHVYRNQLFTSVGYTHYVDALAQVFRKGAIPGAVISSSENLGTADVLSANISWSTNVLRGKWSMTNNVGAFYGKYNTPDQDQNNATVTGTASSQHIFQLQKGFRAELFANVTSPMIIGALHIKSTYSADLGISKSMLQKNGAIAFNVTDVFNTSVSTYTVQSFGVYSSNKSKAESRFFKLVFTYKFGNKQVKPAANRKTGVEVESRRMGS